MRLMEGNQFDTIYHEHYCYFSLLAAERIFAAHGLTIFDVEELWTHGGSLRIYARHDGRRVAARSPSACWSCARGKRQPGYRKIETYLRFEEQVRETKRKLLELLIASQARRQAHRRLRRARQGQHAAQLLRHPRRTSSTSPSIATRTSRASSFPARTSRSSRPRRSTRRKPDYVLILPWNFKDEIMAQLAHIRELGRQVHRSHPGGGQ